MTRTMTFTVTGEQAIHCAGCERRLGTVLRRLPGVARVDASAATQRVTIVYDPDQVSEQQLAAKLARAGFAAGPAGGGA